MHSWKLSGANLQNYILELYQISIFCGTVTGLQIPFLFSMKFQNFHILFWHENR